MQRVSPDGHVDVVVTGPTLKFSNYSTGAVFSTSGGYYFFTNEDRLIMRLQACSPVAG